MTDSISVRIYIAGDYNLAKQVCNRYCFNNPFCINISKRDYVYWCGEESGVMVEIINYPRFPKTILQLYEHAIALGRKLADELCQRSYTIQTSSYTVWWTRKKDGTLSPASAEEIL